MKTLLTLSTLLLCSTLSAAAESTKPAPPAASTPHLVSGLYDWDKMPVTPNALGERRAVFDGSTATVDKLHCHITTLNPGEHSGAPRKHLQDEVIIVKEGTLEANWDGHAQTGGPGSVIFFASGATTFLRNPGKTPATYIVIYYYTPLTPRS